MQLEQVESRRAIAIPTVHPHLGSLNTCFNKLPLGLVSDDHDVVPLHVPLLGHGGVAEVLQKARTQGSRKNAAGYRT